MKALLLAGLLAVSGAGRARGQQASLPIDTESGLVVYRGRVAMPNTAAAVLQQRAEKYMKDIAHMDPAYPGGDGKLSYIGCSQQDGIRYELVIVSKKGAYSYLLCHFALVIRSGEYFTKESIIPRYDAIPVEKILQKAPSKSTAEWQGFQLKIATAAKKAIRQMQVAMK